MKWYAVQCKSDKTLDTRDELSFDGIPAFAPLMSQPVKKGHNKRPSRAIAPLLPGYVFVQLGPRSDWGSVRATPNVHRFVEFNGMPQPIPEHAMRTLRRLKKEDIDRVLEKLKPGGKAELTDGPFVGHTVDVKGVKGDRVLWELLGFKGSSALEDVEAV